MASDRGELRVGIPFDAEGFNEVWRNYTGAGGYFAANNIYGRLVVQDVFGDGAFHPDLARTWDIQEGGGTYVFETDPEARWHDGVPVTAHDVAYTYQQVLANGYHGLSWLQDIAEIEAVDDRTVRCRLQAPNAAFLAQLGSFVFSHVIAKHLYEGTDWDENPHNWEPVGNGPFKFERWIKGDRIELVANDDFRGDGPYLDRLTYFIMPDRDDAHRALEKGDIHFSIHDIPAGNVDEWRAKDGLDVLVHSGNSIGFLAFNWTQDRFRDHAIREAIARAIDREEIANAIHPGVSTPRHYYLEKVAWAFNPDAVAPDFDPGEAERLLDEAGYQRHSDGNRFSVTISARELYPHYNIAANVIAGQLERIGIAARSESLSPVDWLERVQNRGNFDLAMDAGDIGPDPQQMASFLSSDGPRNIMRYSNPIVDEAFREGRATPNKQERGKHYRRLQAALAADIARVPLLQYGEYLPYSDKFTGWSWSDGVRGTVPFWYHGKVRKVE